MRRLETAGDGWRRLETCGDGWRRVRRPGTERFQWNHKISDGFARADAKASGRMSGSLFRHAGGKKCAVRLPSEAEGLALAVAAAMLWAKLRTSANPVFFDTIASECKRLKCTPSVWTRSEMVYFVHQKVFNTIPQEGLENYLTRKMSFVKKEERAQFFQEFVESVLYKYLATVDAGRDSDAAMELAREAKLDKVLQCETFNGCTEWTAEVFISNEVWSECGGQAGLKEVSRKFITLIAAGGQKGKPINAMCDTCGELKVLHKGDRLNLAVHACKCDTAEVEDVADNLGRRPAATERGPKRTRGFDQVCPQCPR